MTCEAFPQGIPDAILENDFDHRQPYRLDGQELDRGLRFEPRDPQAATYAELIFDGREGG
jgi:hypothetical protein